MIHRRALLQTVVSAVLAGQSLPALAAYTMVPTGSIGDKQARLREVEKLFKATPDDPYVFGEKAQLEFDIQALERNKKYTAGVAAQVDAGKQFFSQRLTVPVPDMATAVSFWTGGCGALVLDTRIVDGQNVTRIGFGPESLRKDDGAKFALELVESAEPSRLGETSAVVQYIQLAMPVFRLSKVMAAGGEIESAYGWTQLQAPGGIPLRVKIDETRRDPFEFVALRCNNLDRTTRHYEALGMHVQQREGKRKFSASTNSNSIFENTDALEPERERGSVLLGFDDEALTTGLLLLPPKSVKKLAPVPSPIRLLVLGSAPAPELETSPDGLRNVFMGGADFEATLRA